MTIITFFEAVKKAGWILDLAHSGVLIAKSGPYKLKKL